MSRIFFAAILAAIVSSPCAAGAGDKKAGDKKADKKAKVTKTTKSVAKTVVIGKQAPTFKIKAADGSIIDLAKLTAKGPVLVRLTCGCAGCDKELTYFQTLHKAYKGKGLTSLAIFREPDTKVAKYAKSKKLKMLYAVDTKGNSWKTFQTKTMPTNFLIEKGGRIKAIAAGCDPSGLLANSLSKKVAEILKTKTVDLGKPAQKK